MLSQETAARVWQAYREIETANKLLSDMQESREREADRFGRGMDKHAPTLKDAFGRPQHLQLGIPSGENGHRLLQVAPELGESVIRAHIAKMELALVEANEQARLELGAGQPASKPMERSVTVPARISWGGFVDEGKGGIFGEYPEVKEQSGALTFTWLARLAEAARG
jgi:hypothetical protein